ncbi:MAG: DUF6585 family protein [Polyangiaceae bacterium]
MNLRGVKGDVGLGPLVRRAAAQPIVGWLIFAVGMLLLLAWAGLSIAFSMDQIHRMKDSSGWWVGPLVMAFFFVPFGLGFAIKGYRGRILRFDLHQGGVAYEDSAGRIAMSWNEISGVYWKELAHVAKLGFGVDVTTHGSATATVVAPGKKNIVVDARFPDHVAFAAQVRDAAAEAMLARIEQSITAHQRVYFGPIGIDTNGISLGNAQYPWSAIGSVRWESARERAYYAFYAPDNSPITTIDTTHVPNEIILQVVLGRFGKLSAGREAPTPLGDALFATARRMLER